MTIRLIKSDETFSTTCNVDTAKKTVTATYGVRKTDKSPRYALTSAFDFSGVSQAELLELAIRGVIIDTQRQWRVLANAANSTAERVNPFASVNVKTAIIDASRKTADPVTKAVNALNKLSPAERAAILKALGEKPAKKTA